MQAAGSTVARAFPAAPPLGGSSLARPQPRPSHCAPARFQHALRTGSCLTDEDADTLATALGLQLGVGVVGEGLELLQALHRRLGTRPGEEARWLEHPRMRAAPPGLLGRLAAAFRPTHPAEWLRQPRAWLSTRDIEAVMRQYEDHLGHRTFRFVGVFPSDFSAPWGGQPGRCVSQAMCDLNVDAGPDAPRQLGFVFNLDRHDQRGSHWTALYVGLDPAARPHRFGAFYYDSVGMAPRREMLRFMHRMRDEATALLPQLLARPPLPRQRQQGGGGGPRQQRQQGGGAQAIPRFQVAHNTLRKQFQNTECGVYTMYYLVACLHTEASFPDICTRVMGGDDALHRLRRVFFRPPAVGTAAL